MNKNARLDQGLRRSVPSSEMPPGLHASIMRAVQTTAQSAPPRGPSIMRWLPAAALVALICAVLAWHITSRPEPPEVAFERAGTALATSEAIARAVPGTALAPLTEEWQRVNQDLDNTAQFLLATLP